MTPLPDSVDAGDLITSELFNEILAKLDDLEGRVSTLEHSGTGGAPSGQLPSGALLVSMTGSPATASPPVLILEEDGTYDFIFTINAQVTMGETYTLTPRIVADANQSQWRAVVVNESGVHISGIPIPYAPPPQGASVDVRVRVTIPSGTNGTSADLTLKVASQRNTSLNRTSNAYRLNVGEAPTVAESFSVALGAIANGGGYDAASETVIVPTSAVIPRITFTFMAPDTNRYTVSLTRAPDAGWAVTILESTITPLAAGQQSFHVDVTAPGVTSSTDFMITVAKENDPSVFGTVTQRVRITVPIVP